MLFRVDYNAVTGAKVESVHTVFDLPGMHPVDIEMYQRGLGQRGKVAATGEFVIVPKPDYYAGPGFVLKRASDGRVHLKFKEVSRG